MEGWWRDVLCVTATYHDALPSIIMHGDIAWSTLTYPGYMVVVTKAGGGDESEGVTKAVLGDESDALPWITICTLMTFLFKPAFQ